MYTITKGPSKLVAQRRTGAQGGRAGRRDVLTAGPRRLTRPPPGPQVPHSSR